MSGILLSQRVSRKRYDQRVNGSSYRPEVRAFSLYSNSIVINSRSPVPKIIRLVFIIQLAIHLKLLKSMDLEKIKLAVSRSKRNSHFKQFHEYKSNNV